MPADSPEERLLRLIKGEHKKDRPKVKRSFQKGPAAGESLKISILKNRLLKNLLLKPATNIALIIVLAILSGYFIYNLFIGVKDVDFLIKEKGSIPAGDTGPQEEFALPKTEDYSVYKEKIQDKQLFSAPQEESLAKSDIDLSKKFNLVGIMAGDEPQAIIEDKETEKTYYLYKGQSFNGATVEEIGDGKVVLNYRGRKIILVL